MKAGERGPAALQRGTPAAERGPETMQVGKGIRATLTCAWCGREVPDAKAQQDVASGRILLAPAPTTFLLTSGRPTCIVCGGPLLLEDWRTETPEYGPLHMEATGGPDEGSAAA